MKRSGRIAAVAFLAVAFAVPAAWADGKVVQELSGITVHAPAIGKVFIPEKQPDKASSLTAAPTGPAGGFFRSPPKCRRSEPA